MDFEKMYGEIGHGFIHVHHIIPISTIGEEYKIDPIKDLVPVCPNCHAMLHKGKEGEVLTIDKLKEIIDKNNNN
jgi:5-methylcytosine-specific restriction protein A